MSQIQISEEYENLVELNYQLYSGLFQTLPLDAVEQTGLLLPLLEAACEKGLVEGHYPDQIIDEFLQAHKPHFTEREKIHFLFKVIQYVERQVVLVDALEDAAYSQIHHVQQNDVLRKLMERVSADNLHDKFKRVLENFGSRLILTAHPTQFYPGQVLAIITDLAAAVKQNDIAQARDLLQQLGNTPFFNKINPTPYDEAISLTWYLANIFYPAIGNLLDLLADVADERPGSIKQLMSIGFWPGGDRDGNPFVDTDITRDVARKLRSLIVSCYHENVRALKRRFSFAEAYEQLGQLEHRLHRELSGHTAAPITVNEMIEALGKIEKIVVEKHQGLYVDRLHSLRRKLCVFGFHFASLDIRQDARVVNATLEAVLKEYPQLLPANFAELPESEQIEQLLRVQGQIDLDKFSDPVMLDTLKSLQVIREIQQANGEAGCHRYILSNCKGALDMARLIALFQLMDWELDTLTVDIIPLFESVNDLANAGANMARLYACPAYRQHLENRANQQTVMLGFSDGTKDGGYLMANWAIYQAKEDLTAVSRIARVEVAFFDGRGGPPARGGGSTYAFYAALGKKIESNQIQLTVQGQTVSSFYGNMTAAMHNVKQLLAAGLENNLYERADRELGEEQRSLIKELATVSYESYLDFKNDPLFLPYLEQMSTLKYYGRTNIGSRPTKRAGDDQLKFEDLRAIPFVGAWSQLKQNVPGYYGLGTALEKMEREGRLQECQNLYRESRFFKALIDNSMQSMSKTDFKFTAYMKAHPQFGKFWQMIHDEFVLSKEMALKVSQQVVLLEDNARSRMSIHLRQRVVSPLLLIQQYALMRVASLSEADESDARIELYEKMVMRSLFGNINASRNSA